MPSDGKPGEKAHRQGRDWTMDMALLGHDRNAIQSVPTGKFVAICGRNPRPSSQNRGVLLSSDEPR